MSPHHFPLLVNKKKTIYITEIARVTRGYYLPQTLWQEGKFQSLSQAFQALQVAFECQFLFVFALVLQASFVQIVSGGLVQ